MLPDGTAKHVRGFFRVTFLDDPFESEEFETMEDAQNFARARAERSGRESDVEHVVEVIRVRIRHSVEVQLDEAPRKLRRFAHE